MIGSFANESNTNLPFLGPCRNRRDFGIFTRDALPLIAIIFEQDGVSSSLNGLNATALYIGILLASPLMERPLQKIGYKPMIIIGESWWQRHSYCSRSGNPSGSGSSCVFASESAITCFTSPPRHGLHRFHRKNIADVTYPSTGSLLESVLPSDRWWRSSSPSIKHCHSSSLPY